MTDYKHLVVKPTTDLRFDSIKFQEKQKQNREISDDDLISMFCDWWEQREAEVKP
jgi:hypothetical protein